MRSYRCCYQILRLELWGLLMEHQPERMCASKPSSCAITQGSQWEKMDLLNASAELFPLSDFFMCPISPPPYTHTHPLPWLPPTPSSRTLSAAFLLRWVIAASQYPIIASSVFLSLSPPPLSRLYRKLILKHRVFCTSVRQWPSCMFFF